MPSHRLPRWTACSQTGSATGQGMPEERMGWLAAFNAADPEPAALLSFNTCDTAIAAAVAGQGVVLGRRPITGCCAARRWWRRSRVGGRWNAATRW